MNKRKTIQVLQALDDEIALELFFNNASKMTTDPANGKKLSKKQYYTRLSKLVKSGLLVRYGSKYHCTATGELVIKALDLMQKAIDNEVILRAYDILKNQKQSVDDLASQLIKDQEIVDILQEKNQDG